MALVSTLEEEGQLLTLRIEGEFDSGVLDQIFDNLEYHLSVRMNQVLLLQQNAQVEYEFETGLAFGERVGALLANSAVVMAVVKALGSAEDVIIDTMIFNSGVPLGQFDNEDDARAWLARKAG